MTEPVVTVIVPVRDEREPLRRALASLLAQDWPADRFEILVVDGMSTDGSTEAAREATALAGPRLRVIPNPRRLATSAMNEGLREARGDVVIRLDAHAEAAPDFVRRSVEALARTGADCVGGPIVTVGDGPTGRAIAAAMSSRFGVGTAAFRTTRGVERDVDTVAFGACRRALFDRIGAFDESFVRNADDEFHLRLTRAGGRIVLVPDIRVTYRCRGTLGALARQYFGYGFWKPRVVRKHGCAASPRAFAPPALVVALAASVVAAAWTREPVWLLAVAGPYAIANAVASTLRAANAGWALLPRIAAAFAVLHVAYGAGFLAGLLARRPTDERERIRRAFERRDQTRRPERTDLLAARREAVRDLFDGEDVLRNGVSRVLDIGCGLGDSLVEAGPAPFGIDLVERRVAAVKAREPDSRVAVADAASLPFGDGSFDLCVLFTVLSSILDADLRRSVAAEALRVLRPGGAVIVYEFASNPLNPDVRGVPVRALRRLFPGCRTVTRRTRGPVRWLPTHYVALVRPAAGASYMSRAPRAAFLDFAPPCLGDEEIEEVVATLRSGWLTTGPRARLFEERFAAFVGAPAALAVNSCSAGLHAALFAAGVGPGDAVVTTPLTYVSTVHAIEHVGATPVFADVEEETLNLSPSRVEEAIGRATSAGLRVRALLPVHYAGHPCDMPRLADLAAAHDLVLVEDAAHALPARIAGRLVGSPVRDGVVSAASFSFYANKNLTTGEGGMLTGSPDLVARARTFAHQGLSGTDGAPTWRRDAVLPGFKYNLSDLAAAIGLRQLERLTAFHAVRQRLAARYTAALREVPGIETPVERPGTGHAWHLFVVRVNVERLTIDRDRFVAELARRNVGASVHFRPVPLHSHYRARHRLASADLPVTMRAWDRVVSLPLHPRMTESDVDDVVDAAGDVVRRHRR